MSAVLAFWDGLHTLSVECVSFQINPLLTYHFVSYWVLSAVRHWEPELHWVLRPVAGDHSSVTPHWSNADLERRPAATDLPDCSHELLSGLRLLVWKHNKSAARDMQAVAVSLHIRALSCLQAEDLDTYIFRIIYQVIIILSLILEP